MFHRRTFNVAFLIALVLVLLQTPRIAPAAPERYAPPLDDAPFGLNTHLASRYPDLETIDRPVAVIEDAGAGWVREDIHWYRIQPDPNTWDWSFTDAMVRELARRNIKIVGVLGHPPGWATPYSGDRPSAISFYAPDPQRFAEFSRAVAERYHRYIDHWEIWNEPDNTLFWKPKPDAAAYAEVLRLSAAAVRSVDPDAKILLGGINPYDTSFLRGLIAAGVWDDFDILAVHPYVDPVSPELGNLQASLDAINALASRLGDKPIWVTEIGWPSGNSDRDTSGTADEQTQANYLVRSLLLLWRAGAERIFWYTLKDDPGNPYGLVGLGRGQSDYSVRKASFYAFQTLNRQLANTEFVAMHDPFERNVVLDFETFGEWLRADQPNGRLRPAITVQHSGEGAARLDYNFQNTFNDYVVFQRASAAPIPGEPHALGIWVYGDGSGNTLKVWLRDAEGELLQYALGAVGPPGWRYLQVPLLKKVGPGDRISPNGNGVLDFPARLDAIVLDDAPDTFQGKGTIFLDDLISINGPEAYDMELRRGKQIVDVLWASTPLVATLNSNGNTARLIDRDGQRRLIEAKDGKFHLTLGPSPIFVIQNR